METEERRHASRAEQPTEYTISRNRGGRYCVAIDGRWATPEFRSADDARAWAMAHARATNQRNAGLTEVFGRVGVGSMVLPASARLGFEER